MRKNKHSIHNVNSYLMDSDYEQKSASQYAIGSRVILLMKDFIEANHIKGSHILDVGCGPGNLTDELAGHFKPMDWTVTGIDYDTLAIQKASSRYPHIEFMTNDIYQLDLPRSYDIIYSNEVLHWMPPVPEPFMKQPAVSHYFLEKSVREQYEQWGMDHFRTSLANLYQHMTYGGYAFLQFGIQGQLRKIYHMLNQIITENFHEDSRPMFFPLFYPAWDDLQKLFNEIGFTIISADLQNEDLVEETPAQVLDFVEGFTGDYFRKCLGNVKTGELYEKISSYLKKHSCSAITEEEWQHGIFILKK
ncbi:methyltransferase domain-containing protein [Virgibacillus sp. MSP4-1]|uniref:class I SAM-dependent methyltransferase n=1 Tax=Virgibacillus sp. MSP4-1 TaxID=2700081 RepID=UPI0005C4D70A|nr:class I SAM-dependent methyltransferase [Virgibacillus sp. MSP4-1]QHS23354.1 methyltransferase domain-containing protein [Virgibacillus sp. MSP4-1]